MPSRRTRILCNMSHDETHFRATKKGRFHDLLNVETAFVSRREDA